MTIHQPNVSQGGNACVMGIINGNQPHPFDGVLLAILLGIGGIYDIKRFIKRQRRSCD